MDETAVFSKDFCGELTRVNRANAKTESKHKRTYSHMADLKIRRHKYHQIILTQNKLTFGMA